VKEPAIDAEFAEQNKKEDDKSPKEVSAPDAMFDM
jgi:hypothetical protein